MTIGLDLSVIQTPHRMRGVGATAINFINNLSPEMKRQHNFVIFLYEEGRDGALAILDLKGVNHEVRLLEKQHKIDLGLPGRLRLINTLLNNLRELTHYSSGDPRVKDTSGLDAFLQFDQMQVLPKRSGMTNGLVLYDLIPYVMETDYLWSYRTARQHQHSRKGALRKAFHRRKYMRRVKAAASKADVLLAISEHTKQDFIKYAGLNPRKIKVIHLGVAPKHASTVRSDLHFEQYAQNSWGNFLRPVDLNAKPFLLFVGGADPRRRLNDLTAAYNNLKAQGSDIRLVLVGDTMQGPTSIPVLPVQKYLGQSSYLEDIIFLGFVNDAQREWLYAKALAFVYPSVYEGFGLPILEAMQYGTPVITYKNTSIYEIAAGAALYAHDAVSIKKTVDELSAKPVLRKKYSELGKKQSKKFSWAETSRRTIEALSL